jgi:ketosteroid isomerase-like protein
MTSPETEVLAANEAFYQAFTRRDAEAIDALWAERAPVACVHPGWGALRGRDDVMDSFRAILKSPASPRVACLHPSAHVLGEAAFVVCGEGLEGAELIATNVFVREDGRWKLVHHQAGPVHRQTEAPARRAPPKRTLN